ncbi:MAG: AAA family ATPase [Thermoproteota archaeon]|nr:AAA family ATPase [Thermoproteota archaeon]
MSSDIDNIFAKAASGSSLVKNRQALTIDYVPEKLPFRDEETRALAQVLSTIFKGARPSNLLLFGKPGTGKTAAARSVVDRLAKKASELKTDVTVLFVNAKIAGGSAYKVIFEIAEELGINKEQEKQVHFTGLSMGEATDRVLNFIQKKKLNLVLVIDEIDSLVDRSGDDILYNFTRANQRMNGGFITLIGISNSLTFKDKLDPRVRSSLSEEEIVFNPYTVEQLRQILQERAKLSFNEGAISEAAVNLCAAIAGREHGDARKAIDLLRVAAELAERDGTTKVDEKHVRAGEDRIERDAPFVALKNSPAHHKLVILAIIKSMNGTTGKVYDIYLSLCKQTEQKPLTQRRMTQIVNELDLLGLVSTDIVNQGRYGRSQKIKVMIPLTTVEEALKDDINLASLID